MIGKRQLAAALALSIPAAIATAQSDSSLVFRGDSVVLRFAGVELRTVVRALAPYLRKSVFSGDLPDQKITMETPHPVPVTEVVELLRGVLDTRGLHLVEDSLYYRIVPRATEPQQTPQPSLQPSIQELRLHVIPLKHARAADVAATINVLYGVASDVTTPRGLSSGTLADELRRSSAAPRTPEVQSGEPRRGTSLAGPVTLVPDERTNTLLVRAAEQDVALIREAVVQLDLRPLQVLIEIMIVEWRKDRSFDLGTAGSAQRRSGSDSAAFSLSSANPGSLVLEFMRMSRADVSLRVSAAASRGDARIVSRPVIVVTNNAEARFLVGSQRPFVQISRSLPTDVPVRDQVIQYRDVGTKLAVRPSINQDGYVSLLVQQEMSGATDETQFGAPIISTREAVTEVLVRDGQTMVIGGLTDSTKSVGRSGIPFLSSIPLIGGLFGEERRKSTQTELYLFLTPRVIRTDADIDSLTAPKVPGGTNTKRP